MLHELLFKPEAEKDIELAANWYAERRSGLDDEFITELSAVLDRIRRNPEYYSFLANTVRRARLRRFPYYIAYEIQSEGVKVFRVLHDRQFGRFY